jgi:hypothetical protein
MDLDMVEYPVLLVSLFPQRQRICSQSVHVVSPHGSLALVGGATQDIDQDDIPRCHL